MFFTGAGMSAESGIPTYRGQGGVWEKYDYRKYATQYAFDEDPDRVWDFHDERRSLVAACSPHEGHRLIARAEATCEQVTVVTQNIDGFHRRVGSRHVVELHGNLWRSRCTSCGTVEEHHQAPRAERRHRCGGWWRPAIVWFGDAIPQAVVDEAVRAIEQCDVLVSIGTSGVIYPAAELPLLAKERGAHLIEINPEETAMSHHYAEHLRGPASEMLAQLVPSA